MFVVWVHCLLLFTIWQEIKVKFEKNYGKDLQKSLPKGLAEVKWGGAENLARAIKNGEVIETTDENGVTFCKWQQFEVGKVSGKQESQSISGSKVVNKAQHTCVCVNLVTLF